MNIIPICINLIRNLLHRYSVVDKIPEDLINYLPNDFHSLAWEMNTLDTASCFKCCDYQL